MIAVEIIAAIDNAGTTKTFYFATKAFQTEPSDALSNIGFEPALADPGSLGVHAFSDGATGGKTELEYGEVVIQNTDGDFDALLNYSYDGRRVVIRVGNEEGYVGNYNATFPIVLTGLAQGIDTSGSNLVIRLYDLQLVFDNDAQSNVYLGNNSLPNGIEGVATDIGGKIKPLIYGAVFEHKPDCINTSKLMYRANDGAVADIPAVYDRGNPLTKGADLATNALLAAAAMVAGTYQTCFAEGLFRLPAAPGGQITCDAVEGATTADRTPAQILKRLALKAGVASGSIVGSDVTALDTACATTFGSVANSVVGVVASGRTFADAMDEVAQSVGAWYGFDQGGSFRMARLDDPASGTSVVTIADYDLSDGTWPTRRPAMDNNIPPYRVVCQYLKLQTTSTDIAGASLARQEYLKNQYRLAYYEDAAIKTKFLRSQIMTVPTLLTVQSAAVAEATRRVNLFKNGGLGRAFFELSITVDLARTYSLRIGNVVTLDLKRFGLSGGKPFAILGLRYELAASPPRAVLTLWG